MKNKHLDHSLIVPALLLGILTITAGVVRAHCDSMDGPVVKAAQRALATKNVNLVLIWVKERDESEIRQRFQQTLAVRTLSHQAKQLADSYFFETLVRLHRAGEGEPYTGLKPAGRNLGPVIPTADKAIENGSSDALLKLFAPNVRADVATRFKDVISKKQFNEDDVNAGRKYVEAYITFMHYVEHLHADKTEHQSVIRASEFERRE